MRKLIDKILWIDTNYENIDALRNYLLKCINFNNTVASIEYANQFRSYTDRQVQNLAKERANILHKRMWAKENCKIENKPIKLIIQELKTFNK